MAFLFHGKICSFFKRHKNKFIFTGVFVGGVIGSIKFAEYKLKSMVSEDQKRMVERRKREQTFEQVQLHAFSLVEAMLESVMNKVVLLNDTDAILLRIKRGQGNKMNLWNQLKIGVFSKIMTGIYCLCLVVITVRVQLNQISAMKYIGDDADSVANEAAQVFLTSCHKHMISEGVLEVSEISYKVVKDVLETMPLQCLVGGENVETLMKSIFARVTREVKTAAKESDLQGAFHVALPVDQTHSKKLGITENWLELAYDILESDDCNEVFSECVFDAISFVTQEFSADLESLIALSGVMSGTDEIIEPSIPLAKALPVLNSKLKLVYSNLCLQQLWANAMLEKLSFIVYKSCTDVS